MIHADFLAALRAEEERLVSRLDAIIKLRNQYEARVADEVLPPHLVGGSYPVAGSGSGKKPAPFTAATLNADVWTSFLRDCRFAIGDHVRKRSGADWEGKVCGFYSTKLTPRGAAVESSAHSGSVQIYPEHALDLVKSGMDLPR